MNKIKLPSNKWEIKISKHSNFCNEGSRTTLSQSRIIIDASLREGWALTWAHISINGWSAWI